MAFVFPFHSSAWVMQQTGIFLLKQHLMAVSLRMQHAVGGTRFFWRKHPLELLLPNERLGLSFVSLGQQFMCVCTYYSLLHMYASHHSFMVEAMTGYSVSNMLPRSRSQSQPTVYSLLVHAYGSSAKCHAILSGYVLECF